MNVKSAVFRTRLEPNSDDRPAERARHGGRSSLEATAETRSRSTNSLIIKVSSFNETTPLRNVGGALDGNNSDIAPGGRPRCHQQVDVHKAHRRDVVQDLRVNLSALRSPAAEGRLHLVCIPRHH